MGGITKGFIAKLALIVSSIILLLSWVVTQLSSPNALVFMPKGPIGEAQKALFDLALLLMLIVVVPVFILIFYVAITYREQNTRSRYRPEWDHSRIAEGVWWGFPLLIIAILAVITWQSSHDLDPYKPLGSEATSTRIQVVALQWRWLFIYPDQEVATINYVRFPNKTPVEFTITSDAPMNSFWIPELGGQIYAMPGMSTKLHLQANNSGTFQGSSANLSGEGFADMRFIAESTSEDAFTAWVKELHISSPPLTTESYAKISRTSTNRTAQSYILKDKDLYKTIINKYMTHSHHNCSGINCQKEDQ